MFDVAVGQRAISAMGHVKMMGAAQPFLSGAISKTVNMPNDATVEDIQEAYTEAWRLGVKALAIYRDGSKTAQALRTDAQDEAGDGNPAAKFTQEDLDAAVAAAVEAAHDRPARRRMPRASASRSRTSSPSVATRATSPPACTRTAPSARSSSPTSARKAPPCAA